jgi:hypothetical protein
MSGVGSTEPPNKAASCVSTAPGTEVPAWPAPEHEPLR